MRWNLRDFVLVVVRELRGQAGKDAELVEGDGFDLVREGAEGGEEGLLQGIGLVLVAWRRRQVAGFAQDLLTRDAKVVGEAEGGCQLWAGDPRRGCR